MFRISCDVQQIAAKLQTFYETAKRYGNYFLYAMIYCYNDDGLFRILLVQIRPADIRGGIRQARCPTGCGIGQARLLTWRKNGVFSQNKPFFL